MLKNERSGRKGKGDRGKPREFSNNQIIRLSDFGEGFILMFTPGLLLAGGATLVLVAAEKTMEDLGFHWLGTALRIAVPLIGMAVGVYFLENNPMVWWILK